MEQLHCQKARRVVSLLLIACMFLGSFALAETQETVGEPFCATFSDKVYIRKAPMPNAQVLVWVPADTRLMLTMVNEEYALTSYKGKKGYVYALKATPVDMKDTACEPFYVYGTEVTTLYDAPYSDSDAAMVIQPHTPVAVSGENGLFWLCEIDGEKLYAIKKKVKKLNADTPADPPYEAYVTEPAALLEYPLTGANAIGVMGLNEKVKITASNEGFARVESKSAAGYVAQKKLAVAPEEKAEQHFGVLTSAAPLYTLPDPVAFTTDTVSAYTIVEADKLVGDFSRMAATGLYLRTDAIQPLKLKAITPVLGYWETQAPLYYHNGVQMDSACFVPEKLLVEIAFTYGDYYLVQMNDIYGFAKAEGFVKIDYALSEQSYAAITEKEAKLYLQPDTNAQALTASIPPNTAIWLGQQADGFYPVKYGEDIGYVSQADLNILGQNIPQKPYEVYFDQSQVMIDFPVVGKEGAVASTNTVGSVIAELGDWLYVTHASGEGFVKKEGAWTQAQVDANLHTTQKYALFLNKNTKQLDVYLTNDKGEKSLPPVISVTVAIGKRTTPTPSGTFALGNKERWHYFGPSYVPFAIYYAPGRYVHGPLYWSRKESSVNKEHLKDFGTMATGGCIRTPYDEMLWIFYHCNGDNTTLEVVNGR